MRALTVGIDVDGIFVKYVGCPGGIPNIGALLVDWRAPEGAFTETTGATTLGRDNGSRTVGRPADTYGQKADVNPCWRFSWLTHFT